MALKLLSILCLLAAVSEQTRINIDLHLECSLHNKFEAKISLFEEDSTTKDDKIIVGDWKTYAGMDDLHLEGEDTEDAASPHYEFYLQIEHRCTADKSIEIEKHYLQHPVGRKEPCRTEDAVCNFKRVFRK